MLVEELPRKNSIAVTVLSYSLLARINTYVTTQVCKHKNIHIYTYAYMHVCMYACLYVCIYACLYICIYACMYMQVLSPQAITPRCM